MRRFLVYLSLALLSGAGPATAQNRALLPLREWTSSEGARLKAELIGFDGDNALLRYEDGRRVTVPEGRFSPNDQAELVRARLLNLHWEKFVDSIGVSFFQSYKIPEERAGKEMATNVSFGPNRFNLAIYLITSKLDWRKFDQVICDGGSGRVQTYGFEPDDVAIYGEGTGLRTRVVLTIQPGRNEAFIPILKDQLGKKGVTFKAHSTLDGKSEEITLSPDEMAALAEMLAVYEKAAVLVRAGVIQRAPLQQQTFGAPVATAPGLPSVAGVSEVELAKYKNQRMDSRLGEIMWTPSGGVAEKVQGLGWVGTSVVVRKQDGTVVAIPFLEMDKAARDRILEERIERHAGKEFGESELWWYHFPKDWDENRQDFHQAFTFVRHKAKDDPQLFARFFTSRFNGKAIDALFVQPADGGSLLKIPVEARLTRTHRGSKDTYSILTVRLERKDVERIVQLIGSPKIMVRLKCGANAQDIVLSEEHLAASQEAMALYQWDYEG